MVFWLARTAPLVLSLIRLLDRGLAPLADLMIRLALFVIFFQAGLAKLADWPGTLALFQSTYPLPLLTPAVAAVIATGDELVASVLVLVGLGTRLAALPLLAQALVIQYALGPAYHTAEHQFWILALLMLIARGPGRISLDHAIRHRLMTPEPV
ncbi:MAG: DoxX family protein [Rhodospirillaceae bacterium]